MIENKLDIDPEDSEMNNELYFHLKKIGMAFPDTEEELDHFLQLLKKQSILLPKDLPSADAILKAGLLTLQGSINDSIDLHIEENLAQAAREGGDITEEIMKKMEQDRKKSEDEADNND